jgi:hypothetical protein
MKERERCVVADKKLGSRRRRGLGRNAKRVDICRMRVSLALTGPKHLDEVSEVCVQGKKVLIGGEELLVSHFEVLKSARVRGEPLVLLAQCDDDDLGG